VGPGPLWSVEHRDFLFVVFLCLNFPICKMGVFLYGPHIFYMWVKFSNVCPALGSGRSVLNWESL
jgi:hypothetical protein